MKICLRTGGMAAAFLTSPLDILRTRLQSDFYRSQLTTNHTLHGSHLPKSLLLHFHKTFQILFSIRRIEGWRGLFRRLGPISLALFPQVPLSSTHMVIASALYPRY